MKLWALLYKMRAKEEKGHYFRKSLLLVLLITCVPSLFIAVSSYWIGVNQVENQVFRSHQFKFQQFSESMNKQFDQIALVMSRWATNPLFGESLEEIQFIDHVNQMQDLMQTLLVVGGSNVFIKEAQLFLNHQHAIIAPDGINYLTDDQLEPYAWSLKEENGLFLAYDLPVFGHSDKNASSVSIIFKLPWYSDKPFGAFVLHLNKSEMGQMIRNIREDSRGTSFLIQKTGEWVISPEYSETQLADKLKEAVIHRGKTSDAFPFISNGETYMVSYGEVTKAQWLYVAATPMSDLTAPVLKTSRLILVSSLIGITVALLLAWFASMLLYRPIGRLVRLFRADDPAQGDPLKHEIEFIEQQWSILTRERQTLQERLKLSLPSLRESFLLQLVQGHLYAWDESGLKERMQQLGWDMQDKVFSIILIQLSGLYEQTGRFKENDRQLISFAATNVTRELGAARNHHTDVINFQDLSVGLLCMFPSGRERGQVGKELNTLAQELIATLGKVLGLKVTVILCRVTQRIEDIPELFEQARQAAKYRDLQESYQIIDMEVYVPTQQSVTQYPFVLEKEFLHVMRLGLESESHRIFHDFMLEVQRSSDKELMMQQAVFQLLGSVRHMLIELGYAKHPLFTEGRQFEELSAIREPSAIIKWFTQRIMDPYLKEYQRNESHRSHRLIEQAMELLKDHYMEDLSLEECAERLTTSPYTLSRSFKQVTGMNFVDYIMNLRMDKAKELLIGTELKISDVAKQVGYQHSYFNKIFKGIIGATPTEYRERHRMQI